MSGEGEKSKREGEWEEGKRVNEGGGELRGERNTYQEEQTARNIRRRGRKIGRAER